MSLTLSNTSLRSSFYSYEGSSSSYNKEFTPQEIPPEEIVYSSPYEQFAHLQIPHEDIVSATNNFSDANLIKGSELGKAYKGQLLQSEQVIDIVAQKFDHEHKDRDAEFWKEISMLSTLKHKNLVSIVGFCDEFGKIIVYKHEAKGSLDNFLRDPTLTWMQRLQICVGVAHAVSYIHYDNRRKFSVIHCDIRSSKIFLDDNWEAKLSGFELSVQLASSKRNSLMFTDVCGTHGYRDPTYNQSGSVTHKADMYSFGIVLFEILCGRKAVMVDESNRLLAPLVISQYEGRRLDGMVDPGLRRQMDPQSFQIFSDLAYNCLREQRSQRPNIGAVVMELEKAMESQLKHESPLILKASAEGASSNSPKGKDLKHLEIPLTDIETATGDFKINIIGAGTFGEVYKAEIDHFDSKSFLPLEETSMGQLPKKRSTAAIKRIKIRQDRLGEEGFLAEIEMLSNCKHPNIVSLLGFCKEDSHMILVYEYATNGSLQTYIGSAHNYLTWVQRIKIAIEIGRGLNYLHTKIEDERRIIHRDIKSDNILLGGNFEAKIADFGLSKFRPQNQVNTIDTMTFAGTDYYMDPEYSERGKLSNKIDIYSFGVVLFEMLSGRLANDPLYINEDKNGIAPVARRRFNDKTIMEMVDPRLWNEIHENSFALTKGPNQYSLHAFVEITHQCVAESQTDRPTAEVIVKKLEEALSFQEGNLKHLEIPLIDILSATENFAKSYLIEPLYGKVYRAELDHFDSKNFLSFKKKSKSELPKKHSSVAIKHMSIREDKIGDRFHAQIEMLTSFKHPNILPLLGFCEEGGHMILVFEHASNGSLDKYYRRSNANSNNNLTWVQRVKICIDIARALHHLHTKIEEEQRIIHFDIKSSHIMLGEDWEAKIAGFELPKIHPEDEQLSAFYRKSNAGTQVNFDSDIDNMGEWKKGTYVYSFGVVLFEMLCGRLANDPIYTEEDSNGLVPIAGRHFKEGTIREMVDHRLMEETHKNILTLGPAVDSLDAFAKIAYLCVAEHPTTTVIVNKLEEALYSQENIKDHLKFSLGYISLATQNFSYNNLIGEGGYSSVYRGEVTPTHDDGFSTIAVKRLNKGRLDEEDEGFLKELQTLFEYKHENIIGIVGYCNEMSERIIVYEYASRGSLNKYLKDMGLTWMKRLKICIDIASGLAFLHAGGITQQMLIHRDMNSFNILLNNDWKAKLSDFGHSLIRTLDYKQIDYLDENTDFGTIGYIDPVYIYTGFLTKESDIYSFGVVLFEILSGTFIFDFRDEQHDLTDFIKSHCEEGKVSEMVFEGIKEQITPEVLSMFVGIAYQCLHHEREERPTADAVLLQLKQALELQEDYEMWQPKLPNDYKEIIEMSKSQEIYSTRNYKDLYGMLSRGILLEEGKFFSLGGNGGKNEMISARKFSYKNRWSHKWRSVPESRFHKVAKMSDVSNLKIQVKIKPQLLSPGVNYGVHLVFKFCESRKSVAKRMYVNLKYKEGSESLHAYFATWREDGWMMIELCKFLNHKEDAEFEFLLESFSRCYCESQDIYIEGIEFRAIDNVKHVESKNLKELQQVQNSNLNTDHQLFSQNKLKKKKNYMLLAKEALYQSSDVKLNNEKTSAQSRSQDVIELLRQQVFRIKCKIESQRLSPDTEYGCYLVFKLSEKAHGLHCPVIVRNLYHRKNKEKGIIYFRFPTPCNVNDSDRVPEGREDGWMEVNVWQFNSSDELRDDCVSINLKLISYERTMSGLIISSLEFRPM